MHIIWIANKLVVLRLLYLPESNMFLAIASEFWNNKSRNRSSNFWNEWKSKYYFNISNSQLQYIAIAVLGYAAAAPVEEADHSFIEFGVPQTEVSFQDQSALKQEDNLKSKDYQDFIHQLYRFDKDNLKKVDGLFSAAGNGEAAPAEASGPRWNDFNSPRSFVAPDVGAPEIYEIFSNRQKRALFFRPLFVYREREAEEQHEQALRSKRHRHSQDAYRYLSEIDDEEEH